MDRKNTSLSRKKTSFEEKDIEKTLPLAREPEGGFSKSSKHSYQGREFYVIIYHPSRFASLIHLNILIYRYLNSVTDTSKTEKSITLSITIWGYPSRFSHYTLPNTAYNRLHLRWMAIRKVNGLRFHGMKYFISYHETVCFKRRNTSFHSVKRTDTSQSSFRPIGKVCLLYS